MIRFNCDYSEGAHERILKKLAETNLEQTPGYGEDHYCTEAADIIRRLCGVIFLK
jgi:threonine aldolase